MAPARDANRKHMSTTQEKAQITELLSNQTLSRMERLRMTPLRRFTSPSRGEHISRERGSSIEFKDYRPYVQGDDTRFVDWNIFARLHRPYLKLYHEEEQLHVLCLIDASSSMNFDGKLQMAQRLAAAFGVMGLMAGERVSAHIFNQHGGATTRLPPKRGRGSMRDYFAFVEAADAGGDGPINEAIEAMLQIHRGRGICVVLSDFLTTSDIRPAFNHLVGFGLELWAIQILGPSEIDPEMNGDLRLVDSEDGKTLDISGAGELLSLYHEYRLGLQRQLEQYCQQRNGRFASISAADDIETVMLDTLRRKGWVR